MKNSRAWKRLERIIERLDETSARAAPARALEPLGIWLRSKGRLQGASPQFAHLQILIESLRTTPEWRDLVRAQVRVLMHETKALQLFCRAGLPEDSGFLAEALGRAVRRIMPIAKDPRDLTEVLARLFPRVPDVEWLESLPSEMVMECIDLFTPPGEDIYAPERAEVHEAIALLATRLSALGLSEDVRCRGPQCLPRSSPFFLLPRAYDVFLEATGAERVAAAERCLLLHGECREAVSVVLKALDERGVSVDVVYKVDAIERLLARLTVMVEILAPARETDRATGLVRFLGTLCRDRLRDQTLLGLVRRNLQLLSRKVIERAGHTGEHYITRTRTEYRNMLLSAAGGGLLTPGTTVLKFWIAGLSVPLLVEGILSGANYAASFLLLQLLGCTLATKQPSMTAAALAGALRDVEHEEHHTELVTLIARMVRSQLAAIVGNIGMVIPASILVDFLHRSLTGRPVLGKETAEYVLHSLDPLHSGTIAYAAMTGVLLWMSSLIAGWFENWIVLWRVPEGIEEVPIVRVFGRRFAERVRRWVLRNVSGFGGNISLGMLLGMTPVLGKFSGLPLDVRHVTLSTGALTLAVSALGLGGAGGLGWSVLGIAAIGALNFSVSFALALSVALRARAVTRVDRFRLVRELARRLMASPGEFFIPPR